MKKLLKYVIIAIIGVTAFTSLFLITAFVYQEAPKLESVSNINLTVDYNNNTIKIRSNFTLDGGKTSAFDALDKWCEIRYDDFGWGLIVREIDGVSGNWIYKVNNQSPSVGASSYSLENGDQVDWQKLD